MKSYAVVESLTGGALSALFTSVSGSSDYFVGGTIAYQEKVKRQIGVDGEITNYDSTELALQLARASPIEADVIISTTGYIDKSFTFCIYIRSTDSYKTQHMSIPNDILAQSRPERQRAVATIVMKVAAQFVNDETLAKYV